MFEYINPKKEYDKEEVRSKVLTLIVTLVSAVGVFAVLYYAASAGA
jgi:hypothetical protein